MPKSKRTAKRTRRFGERSLAGQDQTFNRLAAKQSFAQPVAPPDVATGSVGAVKQTLEELK